MVSQSSFFKEKPTYLALMTLSVILIALATAFTVINFIKLRTTDAIMLIILPVVILPLLFLLIKWGYKKHTLVQGANLKIILAVISTFMIAFPLASLISTFIWRKGVCAWDYTISWESHLDGLKEIADSAISMEIRVFLICIAVFAGLSLALLCLMRGLKSVKIINYSLVTSNLILLIAMVAYFSIEQMPGNAWHENSEEILHDEVAYYFSQTSKLLNLCEGYEQQALQLNEKYNSSDMKNNHRLEERAEMFDEEFCRLINTSEIEPILMNLKRCRERLVQCHYDLLESHENRNALNEEIYTMEHIANDVERLAKIFSSFVSDHTSDDVCFAYATAEELGINDADNHNLAAELTYKTSNAITDLKDRMSWYKNKYIEKSSK